MAIEWIGLDGPEILERKRSGLENELKDSDEERDGGQAGRPGDPGWGCGEFRKLIVELHEKWPEIAKAAAHPLLDGMLVSKKRNEAKRLMPLTFLRSRKMRKQKLQDLFLSTTSGGEFAAINGAYYYHKRIGSNWADGLNHLSSELVGYILIGTLVFAFLGGISFDLSTAMQILWGIIGIGTHIQAIDLLRCGRDYSLRKGMEDVRRTFSWHYKTIKYLYLSIIPIVPVIAYLAFPAIFPLLKFYFYLGPFMGGLLGLAFKKLNCFKYMHYRLDWFLLDIELEWKEFRGKVPERKVG